MSATVQFTVRHSTSTLHSVWSGLSGTEYFVAWRRTDIRTRFSCPWRTQFTQQRVMRESRSVWGGIEAIAAQRSCRRRARATSDLCTVRRRPPTSGVRRAACHLWLQTHSCSRDGRRGPAGWPSGRPASRDDVLRSAASAPLSRKINMLFAISLQVVRRVGRPAGRRPAACNVVVVARATLLKSDCKTNGWTDERQTHSRA